MPNLIDATGLTTKTATELVNEITADMKLIYGDDINVDQDTPDGQNINIFAQSVSDVLDLLTQVYTSFDPDQAIGVNLDARCSINGIQRLSGTHTVTNVNVTVSTGVSLVGLDLSAPELPPTNIFTISDINGNIFYLKTSQTLSTGAHDIQFVAAQIGKIETSPGTLTIIKSVILGVVSVTNSTNMDTVVGLNEESDASLRLRRAQSVSLASQGYLAGLKAAIQNVTGVTYSEVYENATATIVNTMPPNSIWAVVDGGSDADIAYAIYTKRNAGCNMKGSEVIPVLQADGTYFEIKFDRSSQETLYIRFDAHSISGVALNQSYIKSEIVANIGLNVNESVNTNDIAALIKSIDPNCLATAIEVSSNGTNWFSILSPSAMNKIFTLTVGRITITVV